MTCERVIGVLDTYRGAVLDQAAFYVELTRARDNVVLLTDDREALMDALETARGEALSALEAIGEQFTAAPEVAPARRPPPGKAPVLDEAARARRKLSGLVIGHVLSAGEAALREHETRAPEPPVWDPGFPAHERARARWREGAQRVIDDCRRVLDDPETYAAHLADHPGADADLQRLSRALTEALAAEAPGTGAARTRTPRHERRIARGRDERSM